jgi:hypothetical protein
MDLSWKTLRLLKTGIFGLSTDNPKTKSMKRIKQRATSLTEQVRFRLQKGCNNLSPQKRMITIMCLCFTFGIASLYMTASSFYSIWRSDQQKNQTHQGNKKSGLHLSDSISDKSSKPSKQSEYE